jgi:hypothetical protein
MGESHYGIKELDNLNSSCILNREESYKKEIKNQKRKNRSI